MAENADLYVQRYNILVETVRVFANTLDQEHGTLMGGSTRPSEIVREHHQHHPNHITHMAVQLAEQLQNLRQLIEGNEAMRDAFLEARDVY